MECESSQDLSHEVYVRQSSPTVEQCAMRADSVHVRHAIVEVNVVIGVLLCVLLLGVRVGPVFLVVML